MTDVAPDAARKDYDDTTVLDDVSPTVSDDEILGVLDPSGCGKTTTLRTAAGFETPTGGMVRFDGKDVTNVPLENHDVGLVFQEYALSDNMTVTENVAFGLKMRGVRKRERRNRVAELLNMFNIDEMGGRDPTALSGGQQQCARLVRTLAIELNVLLLDKSMMGLNAQLKVRLRTEVGALLTELNVTGLCVTHDQAEVMVMCDHVAMLDEGHAEQVGAPREIYESSATKFVSELAALGALDFPFVNW